MSALNSQNFTVFTSVNVFALDAMVVSVVQEINKQAHIYFINMSTTHWILSLIDLSKPIQDAIFGTIQLENI